MSARPAPGPPDQLGPVFRDTFADPCSRGRVLDGGTGPRRAGVDAERGLSIDHGALRIEPLARPGWGRQAIAYGPFTREPGLVFATLLLNGHHASETVHRIEPLRGRMRRWLSGSESKRARHRLLAWARRSGRASTLRQFWRWFRAARTQSTRAPIEDNLAIGWFSAPVVADPLRNGHALVIHAADSENGELRARTGTTVMRVLRGLQNLPLLLVVALREQGAVYYAASLPRARGLVAPPDMRPLALDPTGSDPGVWACIHQSVLGQAGFRAITRVHEVAVAVVPSLAAGWWGSAHVADALEGLGSLHGRQAELGGRWSVLGGDLELTPGGARTPGGGLAVLSTSEPIGLVHVLVRTGEAIAEVGVLLRVSDADSYLAFELGPDGARIRLRRGGKDQSLLADPAARLQPGCTHALQVVDDGAHLGFYVDGELISGGWLSLEDESDHVGVGLSAGASPGASTLFSRLEAHPRRVRIPPLLDLGLLQVAGGGRRVVLDDFRAGTGDLHGSRTSVGERRWRRELGRGTIERESIGGARVRASVAQPNPGRTCYTVPWGAPRFAEVRLDVVPPPPEPGARGRGGVCFFQDDDNYLIVSLWVDESPGGPSLSSFACLLGFEELYDAVWTNVGDRLAFGVPCELRVAFDGLRYTAWIHDEPVLDRALTDIDSRAPKLRINRVGLVANWEWGNDTGSRFERFEALEK